MSLAVTMLTNLISKIHDCSRAEDILQAGVESAKQALACDRVLVYSLQSHNLGQIVAEAVAPGFPITMGMTIDDPCFKARHIDTYSQGRITTIENVEEARIASCYAEMLQKFAIKANIIVPLPLPDNELYGLLIVHQCSEPRVWKPEEIGLTTQIALQIGWALDNAVRWSECQRIQLAVDLQKQYNQRLEIGTQKIHQGNTRIEVLQIATEQARTILECDRAIVYGITEPNVGRIAAESTLPALAPTLGRTIEDPCFEAEYIDRYQHGGVQTIDNIHESGISDYFIENLVRIGIKASLTVPIVSSQDELFGLLVVHQCFSYRHWLEMEIELLRQLGIQTGLALTKAHIQEEATAMKSSLKRAGLVKETIASADTQIQHVKESLTDSAENLEEAKHLLRLLSREVVSLTEKFSNEDISLVRIIAKKLQGNTEKATTGALSLQSKIAELESAIDLAIQVYKSRRTN
jgi:GAF domain-containing protein